jgi:3-oxoacyl-[acyl-carrier-protein] synthase II
MKKLDRATQIAVLAAKQAFQQSRLSSRQIESDRIGITVGVSGTGQFQQMVATLNRDHVISKRAGSYFKRNVPHFQAEIISRRLNIKGPRLTICSASAASSLAIGCALDLLRAGKIDIALAGGSEGFTLVLAMGMDSLDFLS